MGVNPSFSLTITTLSLFLVQGASKRSTAVTWLITEIKPSVNRNPIASSASWPGVRIVTEIFLYSAFPSTDVHILISSGSSTDMLSMTCAGIQSVTLTRSICFKVVLSSALDSMVSSSHRLNILNLWCLL
ncbi:hypothetical protein D3C72_1398590 [compost metagenome]